MEKLFEVFEMIVPLIGKFFIGLSYSELIYLNVLSDISRNVAIIKAWKSTQISLHYFPKFKMRKSPMGNVSHKA